MKLIGIVGGIASGKSFVSQAFQELGARWLNADAMVHQAYQNADLVAQLVGRWGDEVLDASGNLDRSEIAQIVFAPTQLGHRELAWLEGVVHPLVRQRIETQLEEWRRDPSVQIVVLDAPVLLKAGWDSFCDELIFVEASEETRWQRVQLRGWTRQQWQQREAIQTPLEEKRRRATLVISNDGEPDETRRQVLECWAKLIESPGQPATSEARRR